MVKEKLSDARIKEDKEEISHWKSQLDTVFKNISEEVSERNQNVLKFYTNEDEDGFDGCSQLTLSLPALR